MKGNHLLKKAAMLSLAAMFLAVPQARAEEKIDEFTLDPVVVTATRTEKKDLEVPASVRVYTAEDIENTGASNVFEALKFTEGMVFGSQGPGGQSMGNMNGDIVLRGMEKGTIVLLNGVPLNLSGTTTLENLPVGAVERIEMVKGNGAVLYGSQASGGVINIITKSSFGREIDLAAGNQKRKRAGLSWQEGKLAVNYSHARYGDINNYSYTRSASNASAQNMVSSLKYSNKDSLFVTYKFDDNWTIGHISTRNRYERTATHSWTGVLINDDLFGAYNRNTYLRYQNDTLVANLYDNRRTSYRKYQYAANVNGVPTLTGAASIGRESGYKESRTGLDLQKRFDLKKGNIMAGFDVHKEDYSYANYRRDTNASTLSDYDRMNYSIFAQWHAPFTDRWEMDLGARLTWTGSTMGDNNYDNVSPQWQMLYKADKNTSFYTNIGKSFVMPTFSQIFGTATIVGNLDLKPQTGWQYEIGMKHIKGIHAWRAAVFYMRIKDSITASGHGSSTITYENEDFKNLGLELSHDIKLDNGFSFTTGVTFSDPKVKTQKTEWLRKYGRYQINFGVGYNKDKFNASLMGNYLGNRRTGKASGSTPGTIKASGLLVTSLHLSYKPTKEHEIYMNMDNLFNKHVTQTHSSNNPSQHYYQTPRNFEIGYKFSF